ncbi:hypothetical protein GEMRC1_011542 [Eukaryota sp. GEM-RC1]
MNELSVSSRALTSVSISSDSCYAVFSGLDAAVQIYNIQSSQSLTKFLHPTSVSSLDLSMDDSRICSSSARFLHFWDTSSGQEIRRIEASSSSRIVSSRFFQSKSLVLTASVDGSLCLFDLRKPRSKPVQYFSFPNSLTGLSCYEFGKPIALSSTSNGTAHVIDFTAAKTLNDNLCSSAISGCVLSPDVMYYSVITTEVEGQSYLIVMDSIDGSCLVRERVSPRSTRTPIITSNFGDFVLYQSDQTIKVIDMNADDVSYAFDCKDDVTCLSLQRQSLSNCGSFSDLKFLAGTKMGKLNIFKT